MIAPEDLTAIWVTLKLAAISTIFLLIIGTPIAWWLSQKPGQAKKIIEAIVALPLILPPTVLGFYLLIAFAPSGAIGQLWLSLTGNSLAFTFSALVIGSVIYSLPFVVQPLQSAFSQIPRELYEAAATMGAGPLDQFFSVTVPIAQRSFITAASLGFAHTVGEFGVILMIGGNIPGETQVLSLILYEHVETLQYAQAHSLAGGLLVFSFLMLYWLYSSDRFAILKARS
jgi:molybdate transport system permease protein